MSYEGGAGKTCILIAGPTATGKTALAIHLALELNTQIISADSRQCFRELDIGVAKPSPIQLEQVRHYFINSHSIHDTVNAGIFESYALASIREIFQEHHVAVMVGGTGLYIKAFCEGIDEIPAVLPAIREKISAGFGEWGLEWLQNQVKIHDPAYFNHGEIQNPQRLMRALEIVQGTGRSILSFQSRQKRQRDFEIIRIGLRPEKEQLHGNIDHRVNSMMEEGLLEEVTGLLPFRRANALNTVGYNELFDYLDGRVTLDQAVEAIKLHTRHYAKRQMTWFSRDESISWFDPANVSGIKEYVNDRLNPA